MRLQRRIANKHYNVLLKRQRSETQALPEDWDGSTRLCTRSRTRRSKQLVIYKWWRRWCPACQGGTSKNIVGRRERKRATQKRINQNSSRDIITRQGGKRRNSIGYHRLRVRPMATKRNIGRDDQESRTREFGKKKETWTPGKTKTEVSIIESRI